MTTTLCHRLSALSRIELESSHMAQPLINLGKLHHLLLYKPTCARLSMKPRALLRTVKLYLSLGFLHDLFKFLLCLQLHVRVASTSCLRQSTSVHQTSHLQSIFLTQKPRLSTRMSGGHGSYLLTLYLTFSTTPCPHTRTLINPTLKLNEFTWQALLRPSSASP